MATIEISTPDGKTIELNAPDGASPDQIHQAAQMAVQHYQSQNPTQPQQPKPGIMDTVGGMVNQALKGTPMELLGTATEAAKNMGNQASDYLKQNTPDYANRLSQAVTGFSPSSLVKTAGRIPELAVLAAVPEDAPAAAAGAVKGGIEAVGDAAKFGIDAVKGTGAQQVRSITTSLAERGLKDVTKKATLEAMQGEAGKAIGAAEDAAGIGLKSEGYNVGKIVGDKGKVKAFADLRMKFLDRGPEWLANNVDATELQRWRKIADAGRDTAGIDKFTVAKLDKIKQLSADALGYQHPAVKQAISVYNDIAKALESLPDEATAAKRGLQVALQKARQLAERQARLRSVAWNSAKAVGTTVAGIALGKKYL